MTMLSRNKVAPGADTVRTDHRDTVRPAETTVLAIPADVIALTAVTFTIAGKTILDGISAELSESRIGVVGRNGSGKSTLLRLLAGLAAPSQGEIRIGGIEPARDRKAMLSRLGILFQNPDHQILFPTVEEELSFGLLQQGRSKAEAKDSVTRLLADEGRSHWLKAQTNALSQGQRHYLNLLSVLLMRPRTILLDEPFAGLDLPTQTRLARRLAVLPQRLITVTHDPAAVADCERVLWLEAGRIYRDGPGHRVAAEFRRGMIDLGARDADIDLSP